MMTKVQGRTSAILECALEALKPHPGNPRQHSPKQIRQIADSIRRFGFTNPILVDGENMVLAGHGRLAAAKQLGLRAVPIVRLDHLSPAERRAYVIADNKLGDLSRFDRKLLADEVALILEAEPDFDLEVTGFDAGDLELLVDLGGEWPPAEPPLPPPDRALPPLARAGDLWQLGRHRLLCGDALAPESYRTLMGRERARIIFVDPPYNQPAADITGKGRIAHGDFVMASGEMTEGEFSDFLTAACALMAKASMDGALHYVCMDWRHMHELLAAGRAVYDRQLDLCVWAKGQPGMGSPYRQQHELIAVFKRGTRPHVDNIELGRHGRNRSNLWTYSSGPSFSAARQQELAWHATVKPRQLVHDALLDASRRDDLVLDAFGGSGTTLIAAEEASRRARLIEIDPYYCDVILRRFESLTGIKASSAAGDTLADRERQRDVARREADHG